jgi:hypothetical protein
MSNLIASKKKRIFGSNTASSNLVPVESRWMRTSPATWHVHVPLANTSQHRPVPIKPPCTLQPPSPNAQSSIRKTERSIVFGRKQSNLRS